ncbi:MAG: CPBP family intramembrane metalloprotease [Clostridiales bacterium]|nr:CPBP family intramembrane metalloprotease [Clostridiales bacterium]
MNLFTKKPSILIEGEKAKFKPNAIIQCLIFLLIFIISQISAAIPSVIYLFSKLIQNSNITSPNEVMDLTNSNMTEIVMISNFGTIFLIIFAIIYCKFIEKRSLHSMGFVKNEAAMEYFKGFIAAFILFSLAVLIAYLTGSINIEGFNSNISYSIIFIFFLGFLFQGMSEEVLLRGYLMVSLSNKMPVIFAIIINSVIFSLLHISNPGFSFLAFINISLYGILASIYTIKRDSLWGICAFHSCWNFIQGNFYGLEVSGLETNNSILSISSNSSMSLLNGGSFGLEAGLAVSIVLVIGIFLLLFTKNKNNAV